MNIQHKFLLHEMNIVTTQIKTIVIPATSDLIGMPLGIGKCSAVVLYLNRYVYNTTTATEIPANQRIIYYGDKESQARELIAGLQSDIIFCKDLSDVYIRNNGVENVIQATIYLTQEDIDDE